MLWSFRVKLQNARESFAIYTTTSVVTVLIFRLKYLSIEFKMWKPNMHKFEKLEKKI